MAVRILSPKGMVSVPWTATRSVKRGDVVHFGVIVGFALADAKTRDKIDVCVECDLVEADKVTTGDEKHSTMAEGSAAQLNPKDELSGLVQAPSSGDLKQGRNVCGYVHDPAGETDKVVRLVWRNFL